MAITDNHIDNFSTFSYGENFSIGHYNHIGENVSIGNDVSIGHHCIIGANVKIGNNCKIENFVLLKENTIIGNDVFIDSYVRSSGHNKVHDNVTIRYGATIAKKVEIYNGAFISPNVMTIYSTHEGKFKSSTIINANAFIGTAAVLGPGVEIGEGVVIGAMAFVSSDCKEKGIYVGVPATKLINEDSESNVDMTL